MFESKWFWLYIYSHLNFLNIFIRVSGRTLPSDEITCIKNHTLKNYVQMIEYLCTVIGTQKLMKDNCNQQVTNMPSGLRFHQPNILMSLPLWCWFCISWKTEKTKDIIVSYADISSGLFLKHKPIKRPFGSLSSIYGMDNSFPPALIVYFSQFDFIGCLCPNALHPLSIDSSHLIKCCASLVR